MSDFITIIDGFTYGLNGYNSTYISHCAVRLLEELFVDLQDHLTMTYVIAVSTTHYYLLNLE